jgi:hypothetical protein
MSSYIPFLWQEMRYFCTPLKWGAVFCEHTHWVSTNNLWGRAWMLAFGVGVAVHPSAARAARFVPGRRGPCPCVPAGAGAVVAPLLLLPVSWAGHWHLGSARLPNLKKRKTSQAAKIPEKPDCLRVATRSHPVRGHGAHLVDAENPDRDCFSTVPRKKCRGRPACMPSAGTGNLAVLVSVIFFQRISPSFSSTNFQAELRGFSYVLLQSFGMLPPEIVKLFGVQILGQRLSMSRGLFLL